MTRNQITEIFEGADKEQIDKLLDINGADITKAKGSLAAVQAELDTARATIASLNADISRLGTADADKAELQRQLGALKADLRQREDAEAAAVREANLRERFEKAYGDRKFINDLTEKGIFSEFTAALDDKANSGKADAAILDGLTKDRDGIFASSNPLLNMPPIGGTAGGVLDASAFAKLPLLKQMELANTNPAEYARLSALSAASKT